jgi:hypothetical protein
MCHRGFSLRVTAQFANRREVLDVIGIGIGADSEILWNPPEENLHLVSRNAIPVACDTVPFHHQSLRQSDRH